MNYVAVTDKRTIELLPIYLFTTDMGHNQEYRDRTSDSPCHHFLYVEDGEGVFEFPDGTYTVSKGTVVFMRKGYPVIYKPKKKLFVTAWVTFDGPFADALLEYLRAENYAFFESEYAWFIMQNIHKLAWNHASPDVLSMHVYDLIVTYFSEMNKAKITPALVKARTYIEENYKKDISVADIASASDVSESLIYRLFREELMTTPVEYLRDVRIENAKRILIKNPCIKIMDVALRCGFADPAYFCKVFHKQIGLTPKAYQKYYSP